MTVCSVYVLPEALVEVNRLPGHVRQRIRRAIVGLRSDPRPPGSRRLDHAEVAHYELRRLRLDAWRVVYLVDEDLSQVYVLAVRKRPPYQYADLTSLIGRAE